MAVPAHEVIEARHFKCRVIEAGRIRRLNQKQCVVISRNVAPIAAHEGADDRVRRRFYFIGCEKAKSRLIPILSSLKFTNKEHRMPETHHVSGTFDNADAGAQARPRVSRIARRLGTQRQRLNQRLASDDLDFAAIGVGKSHNLAAARRQMVFDRHPFRGRKALEIWDKKPDDLRGLPFLSAFPNAVGTPDYEAHRRALETGTAQHFESVSPLIGQWFEVVDCLGVSIRHGGCS